MALQCGPIALLCIILLQGRRGILFLCTRCQQVIQTHQLESTKLINLLGVKLPADLILVHEFRDHYSLQARTEMTVSGMYMLTRDTADEVELDEKITDFLGTQGKCLTKDEWKRRYPYPTERY